MTCLLVSSLTIVIILKWKMYHQNGDYFVKQKYCILKWKYAWLCPVNLFYFFFKLSASFITEEKALWGAGVERRGAREGAFLLLPLLFLLPVVSLVSCEISAMPRAGIAQVWFPVFIDFFFRHCFRYCWRSLCTTRMWVVPSAAWPHLPLAARPCAPRRCCTMEDAAWQMGFQTMSPPAHPISARALVSLSVKLGK